MSIYGNIWLRARVDIMNELNFVLEHIGLASKDPVALKDWYVRVLNARVVYSSAQLPPAFFLDLPGGVMIEIYESRFAIIETAENGLAGWRHLALRVPSIDSALGQLSARGVVFRETAKPAGGGGRILFFKDLEGNLLHLVERPPEGFPPPPLNANG